jgi:UDP-glucuronate 4-epimerase
MRVLVTGAAGFIGFHAAGRLLEEGHAVVGIDNLNDYYDAALKRARIERLAGRDGFRFVRCALEDKSRLAELFAEDRFETVLHLAAQAGVRYSLENPQAYIDSNVTGFLNVLEACRRFGVRHLVFASSSSVYGANRKVPYSARDSADHPVSLYAATKRANELMAHAYSHLYRLPVTGLRFFTVYGPWGRPDMAYYKFTRSILEGKPITLYKGGEMWRDFTYVDDVTRAIALLLPHPPAPDGNWDGLLPEPDSSAAPYRLYNVGSRRPVKLTDMIGLLEKLLGRQAIVECLPMHPGDVEVTCADMEPLERRFGFRPEVRLEDGLRRFVDWYADYHRPNSAFAAAPAGGGPNGRSEAP